MSRQLRGVDEIIDKKSIVRHQTQLIEGQLILTPMLM